MKKQDVTDGRGWTRMDEADDVSLVHPSFIQTKKELESYPKVRTSHSVNNIDIFYNKKGNSLSFIMVLSGVQFV
jgi:hypothetical protein